MEEFAFEQNILDKLKEIWRHYSRVIIAVTILIVLVPGGWQAWLHYTEKTLYAASSLYEELWTSVRKNDLKAAEAQGKLLMKDYVRTPYAALAGLLLAKEAVRVENFSQAEQHLRYVLESGQEVSVRHIARIRLARLLITQNKAKEALSLLDKPMADSFTPLYLEAKADAFFALGNFADARKWYQEAISWQKLHRQQPSQILQMKIDDLAGSTTRGQSS